METQSEKREIEIDVMQLFQELLKRIWVILLVSGILAVGALLVSKFLIKPIYQSTTSVYILNQQREAGVTYGDVQLATQLTSDYEALIKSRSVLDEVVKELKLDVTSDVLASSITVSSQADTRMLKISVTNQNPYTAQQIAARVCDVAQKQIVEIMNIDAVNLVDEANLPTEPAGPDVKRNALLGGLIGLVISCGVIILRYVLNDTFRTPEDIEKILGMSVLGVIPDSESTGKKGGYFYQSKNGAEEYAAPKRKRK